MISTIFHTILYQPLLNALVFITSYIPGADIGIAVIVLTLIVKFILLPLTHKQIVTQRKMKSVENELKGLREKHKGNKEEETKAMLALYKQHGINPFAGFALIFVQIPILLALFWVFTDGIPLKTELLYSFVHLPENINPLFLGLLDLSAKSIWFALIVGASQYFQITLSLPPSPKHNPADGKPSFSEELGRSMSTNMRYVMPVFVAVIAMGFPAVVALYWLTSNLFQIADELMVRHKAKSLTVSVA